MLINGKVMMAPVVHSAITGGLLSVSGNFTMQELDILKKALDKEIISARK
jgi:hypothetical protein